MAEEKKDVEEGGKSKKKLFIIIGAVVLLLLIGGGVAGFFLLKKDEVPPEQQDPGANVPVPVVDQKADIGPMVPVDEFIVNIISNDTPHYVKASLSIELSDELVVEEVTKRMPQIRDAVLLLIGNKTFEELQDLQGKRQLKAELTSRINSFLQSGRVRSIYFTNFVVQ